MSLVSERDLVASPSDRPLRELLLCVYACIQEQDGRPERGFTSAERTRRSIVAPSLAMSNDVPPVAAERDSQLEQRDEPAHSHTVPIGDGVSPLTNDTSRRG